VAGFKVTDNFVEFGGRVALGGKGGQEWQKQGGVGRKKGKDEGQGLCAALSRWMVCTAAVVGKDWVSVLRFWGNKVIERGLDDDFIRPPPPSSMPFPILPPHIPSSRQEALPLTHFNPPPFAFTSRSCVHLS